MSESENPAPTEKRVGRGLTGLDVDRTKMSPETLAIYQDYLDIANDESPGDNHQRLRDAEHKLRGAINADMANRAHSALIKKQLESLRKEFSKARARYEAAEKDLRRIDAAIRKIQDTCPHHECETTVVPDGPGTKLQKFCVVCGAQC